jgi:hypothetical protein
MKTNSARILNKPKRPGRIGIPDRKLVQIRFSDENGPRGPESLDDHGVLVIRGCVQEDPRPGRRDRSPHPDQVLHGYRNPLQRSQVDTRSEQALHCMGRLHSRIMQNIYESI